MRGGPDSDSNALVRPFRLTFAAGGALVLAHLALPANGRSRDALLVTAAGVCFALAGVIWAWGGRLPRC
jgi:hypothetical protein